MRNLLLSLQDPAPAPENHSERRAEQVHTHRHSNSMLTEQDTQKNLYP